MYLYTVTVQFCSIYILFFSPTLSVSAIVYLCTWNNAESSLAQQEQERGARSWYSSGQVAIHVSRRGHQTARQSAWVTRMAWGREAAAAWRPYCLVLTIVSLHWPHRSTWKQIQHYLVYCRGKKNSKSHHQTEFLENKIKHATKNSVYTKQYKNKLRHKWLSVLSLWLSAVPDRVQVDSALSQIGLNLS